MLLLLIGGDGSSHFIHAQIEPLIADANTNRGRERREARCMVGVDMGCCFFFLVAT